MYNIMFAAHSGWRWLVLLVTVAAVGYSLWGWLTKQDWQPLSRKLLVITTIVIDIQLLLGLVLYVSGQYWTSNSAGPRIAHPLMMIFAIVAIHVTNVRVKRSSAAATKFRWFALGTIATLVLIVLGVISLGGVERLFSMTSV